MAIQILDDPSKYSRIATGLSQGLGRLAQSKSAEMEERTQQGKISKSLQGLGFNPEHSYALSNLPEKLRNDYVKEYFENQHAKERLKPDIPQTTEGLEALGFSKAQSTQLLKLDPKQLLAVVNGRVKELSQPQGVFGNLFGSSSMIDRLGGLGGAAGPQQEAQQGEGYSPSLGSIGSDVSRLGAQAGASGAAGALGNIGNIQELVRGKKGPIDESIIQALGKLVGKDVQQEGESESMVPLPTSENIKEKILPKELAKPQNQFAEYVNSFAQDLGSLISPVPGLGSLSATKALKTAGVINALPLIGAGLGLNKDQQNIVKGIAFLAPAFGNFLNLNKTADRLIDEAKATLKPDTVVRSPNFNKDIEVLHKVATRAAESPEKKNILNAIENVRTFGQKTHVEDLVNVAKSIEDGLANPNFIPKNRHYLENSLKDIHGYLKQYKDPAFAQKFERAYAIKAGMAEKSKLVEYIRKSLPYQYQRYLNPVSVGMLGLSGKLFGLKTLAATAGTAALAGQGEKVARMFINHPQLRKEFAGLLQAAAQKQAKLIPSLVKKFDNSVKKLEATEPRER